MHIFSLFTRYFYTIPIPPLLPITVAFMCGIVTQIQWSIAFIIAFILCACIPYFSRYYSTIYKVPLLLISYAFGSFLIQNTLQNHNDLAHFINKGPVTIQGTITDKSKHEKKWTIVEIRIDSIHKGNEIRTCNKLALLYYQNDTDLCVGDYCTFNNLTCSASKNQDFINYLIKEQIVFVSFDQQFSYSNLTRPTWSFRRFIHTHKTRLLNSLEKKMSTESFRFFSSLFLGNRTCIKQSLENTNEQFKVWGISHFLARSGLHLALFIFIWQMLFRCIPLSFSTKQIFLTLFSVIYFIFTWTSAPFTRAFSLLILHKFFLFFKLPYNLLHALSLVCFCFLLYCPLYLFFLDFQLSFILTLALIWFNQLSKYKK